MQMKTSLTIITWIALIFTTACSSLPDEVELENYSEQPTFQQLRADDPTELGKAVVFGGKVVEVINTETTSNVVILQLPLNDFGRPSSDLKTSEGRFIASFPRLLDPEVFEKDEFVTVRGLYKGIEGGKIGEFDYNYVRLEADGIHLWDPRPEAQSRITFGFGTTFRFGGGQFYY